jgi:hypothetical protein
MVTRAKRLEGLERFERLERLERFEQLGTNGFLAMLRGARVCMCLMPLHTFPELLPHCKKSKSKNLIII